jgi:hypothetical protein
MFRDDHLAYGQNNAMTATVDTSTGTATIKPEREGYSAIVYQVDE